MVSARGAGGGAAVPRLAIGLDLGGTELKAGLVAPDGALSAFRSWPSRARESAEAPLEVVAGAVAELRREAGAAPCVVGLGCPGVIAPGSGALVGRTPHLPHWDSLPLRERLGERLDADLVVENDANTCPWCGKPSPTDSLRCPKCRSPIQTGQRACAHCGLELKLDCPRCGKPTFLGDFCESCGARLLAKCPRCGAEQVPLGERCASCDKKIKGGWKI